jgi:RsiW-degrading membrane proteinase PrsW (M82 family)
MLRLLALLGAAPALLGMFIVKRADAKRPEPPKVLRRVAAVGALSAIPACLVEFAMMRLRPTNSYAAAAYMGFIVAAIVEESAKGVCLARFALKLPEFDEHTDGVVYGTHIGLGFALVENVGYLFASHTAGQMLTAFISRALLAVPMHAITGAVIGHFAARRRFDGRGAGLGGGVALAILLHGAYDTSLFMARALSRTIVPFGGLGAVHAATSHVSVGAGVLILALVLCPIAIVVFGLFLTRRFWRDALARDDAAAALRSSGIASAERAGALEGSGP